ncbi:MAG: adenylate/guanylate cyclase domain-containing protein [Bacteroidetes bacterium]|nr:adenylate/guanylate cyclase domain-containing protein [Bacteroidota bacterium]
MLSNDALTYLNSRMASLQTDRVEPELAVKLRDYITKTDPENLHPIRSEDFRKTLGLSKYPAVTLLLKSVKHGLMDIDWSTCCPKCSGITHQSASLENVEEASFCPMCTVGFDLTVDENLQVIFSVSENLIPIPESVKNSQAMAHDHGITGSDLLNNAYFRHNFSNEVVSEDRGLKIKNITLLFTDLKGSTELYEKIGDLNAYRIVREHFVVLDEIIGRNNGTVVKTIGDAVMASFSNSEDGLNAGIEIQEHFTLSGKNPSVVIKMGLHAGPALVVNLNGKIDYFGSTVNIAARVQNLSKGGDVFISKSIFDDPRSLKYLRKMPAIFRYKAKLKGIKEDYQVYQLNRKKG